MPHRSAYQTSSNPPPDRPYDYATDKRLMWLEMNNRSLLDHINKLERKLATLESKFHHHTHQGVVSTNHLPKKELPKRNIFGEIEE